MLEQQPQQTLVPDPRTPHFIFRAAQTEGDLSVREAIYSLRYEVYCLECGFLPAAHYERGMETDEYDECSTHFTAHNLDNELVGTLRLVQPRVDQPFPFENHCKELFENITLPPKDESGEVSRLVVRKSYRRRTGDTLAGVTREFILGTSPVTLADQKPPGERRSNSPEVLLGLYRQMYRYSVDHGIRYWYAAMERSLVRALSRFEFIFNPIGLETDYYGPVAPYLADLRELERRLDVSNPDLMAWFRQPA